MKTCAHKYYRISKTTKRFNEVANALFSLQRQSQTAKNNKAVRQNDRGGSPFSLQCTFLLTEKWCALVAWRIIGLETMYYISCTPSVLLIYFVPVALLLCLGKAIGTRVIEPLTETIASVHISEAQQRACFSEPSLVLGSIHLFQCLSMCSIQQANMWA